MYLTAEQANDQKLIRYTAEQVLDEPIGSIEQILSGHTSYTYEINNHIIFKLPNEKTSLTNWESQNRNTAVLKRYLTYRIPDIQLKPVFLNATSENAVFAFYYEKIPGKTLSRAQKFSKMDPKFKTSFFEQAANFATQLHAIPINQLPVLPPSINDLISETFLTKSKTPLIRKVFTSTAHLPLIGCPKIADKVLCHRDLHPGNICLDNHGKMTGILDFDLMCTGERFVEFYPRLYADPKDQKFFQKTYSEVSGFPILKKDLFRLRSLCFLYALHFLINDPKTFVQKTKQRMLFFKQPNR